MNMCGQALSWSEVAAVSGDAFRFAFEPHWAKDAEYISDINMFAQACNVLGFTYTQSVGKDLGKNLLQRLMKRLAPASL